MVSRSESFSLAARKLLITQSAVSRRIKALEDELGTTLLHRDTRTVRLTEIGKRYLEFVGPAFDALHQGTRLIKTEADQQTIRLRVPPSVAIAWLMPLIGKFPSGPGEPRIVLDVVPLEADFLTDGVSMMITFGYAAEWPGLRVAPIMPIEIFPVMSPERAAMVRRTGMSLFGQTQIHVRGLGFLWDRWREFTGNIRSMGGEEIEFDSFHLCYEAAASGAGVALGVDFLCRRLIERNLLEAPFPLRCRLAQDLFLVGPRHRSNTDSFERVLAWLREQTPAPLSPEPRFVPVMT